MITEALTNFFCSIGIYRIITVIWQLTELHKTGRIQQKRRDTYIAFAVTLVVVIVLAAARAM